MTLNHRRSQGYIRMICGECVHYSTHTLVERLAEKHPRSSLPSLKAVSPFYSGSNTRSSFTLFTTENDDNGGGSRMSDYRPKNLLRTFLAAKSCDDSRLIGSKKDDYCPKRLEKFDCLS